MEFEIIKNYKNRKIGFEFEFGGLSLENSALLVAKIFDGKVSYNHSSEAKINSKKYGDFVVELDAAIVKNIAENLEQNDEKEDSLKKQTSKIIGSLASKIVPCEIVTPPLNFEDLPKLQVLCEELYKKEAKGTKSGIINAFGMHINIEIPSRNVDDIKNILRAFIILYPWLVKKMKVDFARNISKYIKPFPKKYSCLILDKNYNPSWDEFIDDYLKHNLTRNRALDLLPLFAEINNSKLDILSDDEKKLVKARPAFHYRLPNCEVSSSEWNIARDWNYWCEIEKLAFDSRKLDKISQEYLDFGHNILNLDMKDFLVSWPQKLHEEFQYEKI